MKAKDFEWILSKSLVCVEISTTSTYDDILRRILTKCEAINFLTPSVRFELIIFLAERHKHSAKPARTCKYSSPANFLRKSRTNAQAELVVREKD